ncbi:hypothetical protein Xen7305DRAFT_00042560 [Xenococcus sp. PCC 7305]|uniref:photosystem II assembly protein Psb34 n=1 Tax=Xenococcus sp. PCC 7305 TaxID=102125 RepID=UPI0002AC9A3A|nr:ssl1498 family light-harvesting-like protein [Xenococcus sp. PCC 7305]ELS04522.1 hypothetical protein Xen7305DRAFT_00042560 [Xenococcus sp. PCC 7305]
MPYTTEEGGRLNNFAREPQMYQAEPPTPSEKRNFLFVGIFGAVVTVGAIAVAVFATGAS